MRCGGATLTVSDRWVGAEVESREKELRDKGGKCEVRARAQHEGYTGSSELGGPKIYDVSHLTRSETVS
jgi:hypothetical protein